MPAWQEVSTAAADLATAQAQLQTYGKIADLYEQEVELLRTKAQRAAQDADSAEALAAQKRERANEESGALAIKRADLGRIQVTVQEIEAVIAKAYRVMEEANRKRVFEHEDGSEDPPPPGQSRPVQDVRNGRIVSLPAGENDL
ncbi:hypothetical protein A4X06_0g2110 [Tilletia controversa]|uniref:Uncharacterized protein n=1 Tax=Tilletia controversa TaxID=13291 RepID=A0A8X7SZ60_9BASI|nr:hypothetical protein A4X06_0g2110 [Tilletia controversa]